MEDFEDVYADELEMLREFDGTYWCMKLVISAKSFLAAITDHGTPSRRTLTLDSPSLPPGASASCKHPLKESPLPFPPVDPESQECKFPS